MCEEKCRPHIFSCIQCHMCRGTITQITKNPHLAKGGNIMLFGGLVLANPFCNLIEWQSSTKCKISYYSKKLIVTIYNP